MWISFCHTFCCFTLLLCWYKQWTISWRFELAVHVTYLSSSSCSQMTSSAQEGGFQNMSTEPTFKELELRRTIRRTSCSHVYLAKWRDVAFYSGTPLFDHQSFGNFLKNPKVLVRFFEVCLLSTLVEAGYLSISFNEWNNLISGLS